MRGDTARHPAPFWLADFWPCPVPWRRACAGLMFAAAFTCAAQDSHPVANPATQPASVQAPETPADPKPQAAAPDKQTKQQKATAADTDRKKQIADESTQLLTMALALKLEVDKTTKDTLSLNVIRKADEIEKLAHTVKEKMKQTAGPG